MVLLTIVPPWGSPRVPIGLGYISQFLVDREIQHDVLDLNMEIFNQVSEQQEALWLPQNGDQWFIKDKFARTLERLEPQVQWGVDQLAAHEAEIIGFSTNQSNLRLSIEVARRLKRRCPDKRLIFGGLGVFLIGERLEVPEHLVDVFVIGEGEVTFLRLLEKIEAGEEIVGTTGTIHEPWRLEYVPRPQLQLREHSWPRYDKFDVKRYPNGGEPFPVGLGRGCVCRCSFCGDYPFWGKFRSRSGDNAAAEIEHHVSRYGIREFEFNDLAINGDIRALERMCELIIDRGLDIRWSSYAYITRVSDELADKLRRSGCVMLRFGMESASNSVLKRMRKPHRAEVAADLLRTLHGVGIKANIGLMAGFPQETDEELDQTIAFLQHNQRYINEVDSLSLFYIKPLSYIEQHPEKFDIIFPEDHHVRWNRWEGTDGSTYEQRKARALRLLDAIEASSIRFQRCNIFGMPE
jgi:radical SAM superfamily enzyme YgiQ (UPF0313 family)